MREHTHAGMSLYGSAGSRKYLNAAERRRFAKAALRTPLEVQLFCIVLSLTGGRISEILAVTPAAIDIDSGVVNIVTLKRRKRGMVRQVPLPRNVIGKLEITPSIFGDVTDSASRRIWKWSRTTAWRRVKEVMAAAHVTGTPAMPKGLRHGFGVNAFQSLVPPHLVQRWLGHASLRTFMPT
jgi:integrase